MITMEMQVLEAIKSKPEGMRLREIGYAVGCWHVDCLEAVIFLRTAGYVSEINVPGDRANGEVGYILYKWTGKGR